MLQFIRVLDTYEFGGDEEDESASPTQLTDRTYWDRRARPEALATVDGIVALVASTGIEPKVTYKAALHADREQAEAETMGDLLDIERQEAALTWQAQAQALPIEHRADISPVALLAVRLVTTPRAARITHVRP